MRARSRLRSSERTTGRTCGRRGAPLGERPRCERGPRGLLYHRYRSMPRADRRCRKSCHRPPRTSAADRGGPPPVRPRRPISTTRTCNGSSSRRFATTTRASRVRPTSWISRSTGLKRGTELTDRHRKSRPCDDAQAGRSPVGSRTGRPSAGRAGSFDLIDLGSDDDDVVIVDAMQSNTEPGTVLSFDGVEGTLPFGVFASTHSFGPAAVVELARTLDRLPRSLTVIGIEADELGMGRTMTPRLRRPLTGLQRS